MSARSEVDIVGVYPVEEAPEPCHLIEMTIAAEPFGFTEITQAVEDQPHSNWQVPWDEKALDEVGERVVANAWDSPGPGEISGGRMRFVFFFHYLDLSAPLLTPWGEIELPAPSPRPIRLAMIEYEEP